MVVSSNNEVHSPGPRVAAADLRQMVASILEREGMSTRDAMITADVLVWADLRGSPGHGVKRLERYLEFIRCGDLVPNAKVDLQEISVAAFICHGNRAAGPVALSRATDEAAKRARKTGVAFGLVRDTTHTGAVGRYVESLAEAGCVGIVAASGPPNMAYHGASRASLSTSPIAISVPTASLTPILDMATAAIPMGRLRSYAERGENLPPGCALDGAGRPTTDPVAAEIPLPIAGPKGSGLSFMFECIASILSGAPIVAPWLSEENRRHRQNVFVLAIDVASFRPPEGFMSDVSNLIGQLKQVPPQDGVEQILAPGERGTRTAHQNSTAGILLSQRTWAKLQRMAQSEAS